jgi:hypothetical protein
MRGRLEGVKIVDEVATHTITRTKPAAKQNIDFDLILLKLTLFLLLKYFF